MTSCLNEPSGLGRQGVDSAGSYFVRGSDMAASAFAITASARSIAARNSSLFQVSTCSPSSHDSSLASCARETNSRSAAMASESSLASASLREDRVNSLTPSHCNYGSSGNIVTKDDHCNCLWSQAGHLAGVWLCPDGGSGRSLGAPVPRQQLVETLDRISIDHPLEHVAQVDVGFDVVELTGRNQRAGDSPTMPAAFAAGEQMVLAAERHRPDRAFDRIGVELNAAIMQVSRQPLPARERVRDRFGKRAAARDERKLRLQPGMQCLNDWLVVGGASFEGSLKLLSEDDSLALVLTTGRVER